MYGDTEVMTSTEMIKDTGEMINLFKRVRSDVTYINLWVVIHWRNVMSQGVTQSIGIKFSAMKNSKRNLILGPNMQDKLNCNDDSCNLKELPEQYGELFM